MPCEELEKLRTTVRALNAQMKESRKKTGASSGDRRDGPRHVHGSSHEFLKRKIARAAAAIEHHVAKHRCQEAE